MQIRLIQTATGQCFVQSRKNNTLTRHTQFFAFNALILVAGIQEKINRWLKILLTHTACYVSNLSIIIIIIIRRIFHFRKHESVCIFMCGLGRMDFIHLCHKMRLTFIRKGHNSTNHVVKFFTRLFTTSQDFIKLCNVIDTDYIYLYKVSFSKINRLVHKHFSDSCLV